MFGKRAKAVCLALMVVFGVREANIESLAAALPAPYNEYLAEACRVLRNDPDRPTKEALGEVLDRLWEVGLKDQLQAALQGLDVRFAAIR